MSLAPWPQPRACRRAVRALALGVALAACAAAAAREPIAVGWIERVRLGREGILVTAKLDTGADHSSLHAESLRWERRADGEWVVLEVASESGQAARLEAKVVRIARIKRPRAPPEKRPTIVIGVCLDNVYALTEVNLADRSQLSYPMLVGRSFLARRFVVDPARTYTVEPDCREPLP